MGNLFEEIISIRWQLYITREINVATEDAMHQGWCKFTEKTLGQPLLKRLNFYRKGVAKIYVSESDLRQYRIYLNSLFETNGLERLCADCLNTCKRVERRLPTLRKILLRQQTDLGLLNVYRFLKKETESLAAALILPRLIELAITKKNLARDKSKVNKLLSEYSGLNERRRSLVSDQVYPLWNLLFTEIGRRKNVSGTAALFLLPNELLNLFNGSLEPKKANRLGARRYRQSLYLTLDGNTHIVTTGLNLWETRLQSGINTANFSTTGKCASRGITQGKSRLVIKADDYRKIQFGDILVTPMTRPDITPYLTKISGLITDDGGVLCHAAIVAREHKIPCLTGTKYATQILQDGDSVYLDATSGYYRKLSL